MRLSKPGSGLTRDGLRRAALVAALILPAWLAFADLAAAELVFLTTGRTLTVRSHRFEGDLVVLTLRAGGEIVCAASSVERIAPDEVAVVDAEPESRAATSSPPVPYGELIEAAAARAAVDPRLVRAVIQVESAYQASARSRKGAIGLMQLMPDTARRYAVADPYDPVANIDAGTRHLKMLLGRFELSLALAAYNAGESAVERFGGIPPYPETQNYVRQVMLLLGPALQR
jgi:soluble lytic murein transglycosylase-like protein